MNILQVLPELNEGGVERGTVDLAIKLVRMGHKSIVISNRGRLVKDLLVNGVKHYPLPVHKKSLFTILKLIPQVEKIIERENVDIIHARSRVPAIISYFAYRRYAASGPHYKDPPGVSFITTCHGYYSTHITSRIMGWGKIVITPSSVIARHMIEDFGVPVERIRVIPRGVSLGEFKYRELKRVDKSEYTIGVIGRLSPTKGHPDFLKATVAVVRQIPKCKILIVGGANPDKKEYKRELELLTRRLGLERYVEFTGYSSNVPEILKQLDLLVFPSVVSESFGRVIIEAQAVGVPVVATKVGGVTDIIQDRVNGLLVPAGDVKRLASAILELLKDKNLALEISRNARKIVKEKFSLDRMISRTVQVYKQAKADFRILIIKLSALGDVILSIPGLQAIRERFPKAKIVVLTTFKARWIVQNTPYVDDVIIYPRSERIRSLFKAAKILRQSCFDIVIDLQNNKISHLLSYLSGSPRRYGYDNGKLSFLLNYKIKDADFALSPIEHQFRMLSLLGITPVSDKPEIWLSKEDEEYIDKILSGEWLSTKSKLVCINPGASFKWYTKRWPVKNFAKLCDRLSKNSIRIVIIGTEQESNLARRLNKLTKAKLIILSGKTTLGQLASLIKRSSLLITGDSAPLHIAAAFDIPCIGLFGPTDPKRHTQQRKNFKIITKNLSCSPCYRRYCKSLRCMKEISVDEVYAEVESFIYESGTKRERAEKQETNFSLTS